VGVFWFRFFFSFVVVVVVGVLLLCGEKNFDSEQP
jgi:Trk-type K+ transport system membrane component